MRSPNPRWSLILCFGACVLSSSPFDWPDVLGGAWLFDQGSTFGFQPTAGGIRGPAPDWALGGTIPVVRYAVFVEGSQVALAAVSYPGSIVLIGNVTHGGVLLTVSAQLTFKSANTSVVRIAARNHGPQAVIVSFRVTIENTNVTELTDNAVFFSLQESQLSCFSGPAFGEGGLFLSTSYLENNGPKNFTWSRTRISADSLVFTSSNVSAPALGLISAFVSVEATLRNSSQAGTAIDLNAAAEDAFRRWTGYLESVLAHCDRQDMKWAAVKAVMTLMNNWRSVPGLPDGVLPSYNGYESGFWSWDTYKQAVGMVSFAPQLAKDQLRLLVSARDKQTGHIPDKVDRCGNAGGCNGKPPLLAWAVWEIFQATHDTMFLQEMYIIVKQFHEFWYSARDVRGAGLCSWTQGMESGMDDGVRFMPRYASSVSNASSHAA